MELNQAEDDINADEEIKKVLEGDTDELDKSDDGDASKDALQTKDADDSAVAEDGEDEEAADQEADEEEEEDDDDEQNQESVKKLLKMQLSTQTLQKLLKQGKMEKLPTGSFRISSEALKELRKETQKPKASTSSGEESLHKRKYVDDDEEISPSKTKYRRGGMSGRRGGRGSRGRSRVLSKAVPPALSGRKLTPKQLLNLQSAQYKMLQQKRIKKKPKIHDYVSDFNSSDEEDGEQVLNDLKDSLAELAPRKTDQFSKNTNLLFEQLHQSIFGDLTDESEEEDEKSLGEDERMKQLAYSDPDFEADSSTGPEGVPEEFFMTGTVGTDGKTVMSIRSTGKRRNVDGEPCPVFTIDTSVEQSTTTTPLIVTELTTTPGCVKEKTPVDETFQMSDPDLVEQLMNKNVSLRKYKEQVKVLRRRYLQLARHLASRPQLQTIGDLVAASSRFLTQDQLLFYTMQLKGGCDSTQGARFSVREKLLALGLYQQEPDTYKWLQRIFLLPSTAELERWLDSVARGNPMRVKQLMYYIYTRYCFRPRDDVFPHTLSGY